MPVRDRNDSIRTAQNLGNASAINGDIGFTFGSTVDRNDYYRFNVDQHSRSTIRLEGLTDNADLALLHTEGKLLRQSKRQGRQNEAINLTLKPGTYILQVIAYGRATSYQLRLSSNPISPKQISSRRTKNLSSSAADAINRSPNIVRLTNNGGSYFPHISSSNVVWRSSDGNDEEIFLYSNNQTTQLTNNSSYDSEPRVSDSHVTWISRSGTEAEIISYNRSTGATTQITSNTAVLA